MTTLPKKMAGCRSPLPNEMAGCRRGRVTRATLPNEMAGHFSLNHAGLRGKYGCPATLPRPYRAVEWQAAKPSDQHPATLPLVHPANQTGRAC